MSEKTQTLIEELIEELNGITIDMNDSFVSFKVSELLEKERQELELKQLELKSAWKAAEDIEASYKKGLEVVKAKLKSAVIEAVENTIIDMQNCTSLAPRLSGKQYYKANFENN